MLGKLQEALEIGILRLVRGAWRAYGSVERGVTLGLDCLLKLRFTVDAIDIACSLELADVIHRTSSPAWFMLE